MQLELITLKELLRDPQYREFFTKVPKLPEHYTPDTRPWKLLIIKPGETVWRSKRFGTYQEAFVGLKKMMSVIDNAAINCPALGFMPPVRTVRIKGKFDRRGKPILKSLVWKPRLEAEMGDHHWCPHCRRPSIFKIASLKRSAVQGEPMLRCMICGASERIVNLRSPQNNQGWDVNRPVVYE